jgi:hypothetical protein
MATRDTLIFSGRKWPGVRREIQDVGYVEPQQLWQFAFTASGYGQGWHTSQPLAFWRCFVEIDFPYTAEALRFREALQFIARHGDPLGHLDNGKLVSTNADWPALQDPLGDIAAAWDQPDAGGVSHISRDLQRLAEAQDALHGLADPDRLTGAGLPDIEWIAQGRGLVPRAKTLQAFMIASAASALERGIAMRRCRKCSDWFELRRSDAVYCSGSCQAAHSKQRAEQESTHGKRAPTRSPRSNHLPRRVARKRPGRKVSPKK